MPTIDLVYFIEGGISQSDVDTSTVRVLVLKWYPALLILMSPSPGRDLRLTAIGWQAGSIVFRLARIEAKTGRSWCLFPGARHRATTFEAFDCYPRSANR